MEICDNLLSPAERSTLRLRALYTGRGYAPFRMSKFEEYDFYARNKDFLVSDQVITFTDTDGKLLALKPDVTLSIIRGTADDPASTRRVCYAENVYRVSQASGGFREIMQTGLECFGAVGEREILEVLTLAAETMALLGAEGRLVVSTMALAEKLLSGLDMPTRQAAYRAMGEKNPAALPEGCPNTLRTLMDFHGTPAEAIDFLAAAFPEETAFPALLNALMTGPFAERIRVDFSLVQDVTYYNGTVFRGYLPGIPAPVLSGGQYDRLMSRLHRRSSAVGFAVYTDLLEGPEPSGSDGWLNIALPKGRLGEKVYGLFAQAGFPCPALLDPGRKLIFENPQCKVRYFWVKPSDVAIYVERGAADLGVAGKDILLEAEPDVFELLDLGLGKCRMAVAAPKGFRDDPARTLRVATKFSHIASRFYRSKGRDIDIIHLNGSIELAPILGLSQVIVDIVETGTTLRENDLEVVEEIFPISARLIANKAAYTYKQTAVDALRAGLAAILEEGK